MNFQRRQLLVTLALAPVSAPAWPGSLLAIDAPPRTTPLVLRATGGTVLPSPPLRYGTGFVVLRAVRGVPLRITLDNALSVPMSLDLHGMRVPPTLGGAGPLGGSVAAGTSAEITLTPPDAGTFWFHPWSADPAGDATAQGLTGALIVSEDIPPDFDADLVALVTDRWPILTGSAASPDEAFRVNGDLLPRRETIRPGTRVRLRLINGSTRQAFPITCQGAAPVVIAIDGQPCPPFRPRGASVPLGPGARADLIVDAPQTVGAEVSVCIGAGSGSAALVLRTEGEPRAARGPVVPLPTNPLLPATIALEHSTRATLVGGLLAEAGAGPRAWAVNGRSGVTLPTAPLVRVKRGSPVTLTFRNAGPDLVAFRVHGFCLRVLHDLDDGWEPYWRDTVLVAPGTTHHVAFVADLPGRWLIGSAFFGQAASGLRTWFEVN